MIAVGVAMHFPALTSGDLMAIVAIHATMLTLILSILAAYGLYAYGKVDDLRSELFEEGARINDIEFAGKVGGPFSTDYITSDPAVREKQLARVSQIGRGDAAFGVPGNDADQGDEFLRLISAISSYYPFPATAKPDGTWLPTPEPLRLKTVDELRGGSRTWTRLPG